MSIISISSGLGGSWIVSPLSFAIVVVTRKKINSRKAISAIELELISGCDLFERAITLSV
jgi:hypothetical protein